MCGREPTGPRVGEISGTARFVLQPDLGDKGPLFQAAGLQVDRIHIVIRGADGTIVFERDVVFPAGQNEVSITAEVPVHGETERFRASYELFSGTTAMFTGTVEVTGKPGVTTTTPSVAPTTFVGPGATATRVDVTPATSTLLAGATTTLTASAFDNANAAILGTPFVWTSSNPTVASVSPAGVVTAGNTRGNATISASTISGVTGSATVSVSLPAVRIIIVSGDAQTGRAGQALAAPIVFEVQASDGVVVPNAAITFAAVSGGGSVNPASAASAATGRASLTPTLGGTLGAQTFRATTGAFSVTATATATPGTPTQITIVGGNTQTDSIGRQLLPFVVRATDTFGNLTPGISVAWARTQGAGTVSAATSLTDAQGQAQIIYTLGNTPGNETVTATLPAPSTANVSFTANAIARQAASLTIVSGNGQGGTVGQAASPLVVQARDALGNPTVGATINWTTAGGGTLGAATSTTDAQGQAQDAFTHGTIPGVTTVTARLATNPNLFANFALTAYAGTVAALQIVNGNGQTAATGAAVATPPAAEAVDAFGNPVPGVSVTFTPSAGGSVTGSPAITNAAGIATVGSWTLGPAGPNTLTASVGALVANFSATATAPVGPNTLSITTQPSGSVQNTAVFPQQPSIQLKNAAGGNLLTSGVVVTVSVQSGTATLRGTLTASTNASGIATFAGLSVLGATGNITLGFAAGGFTGVTSGTMVITVGPAAFIAATTATAFGATVGSVVSPVPQVIVKDSSNTPISGVAVTWATPAPGNGGLITGGGPVTNGSGLSSPVQWTLDAVPGNDTLTAAVAGALGSPVYFVATTTAGAATQLAIVSGNNQTGTTGTPLAAGMVVVAKDALNNPVSGVNITFTSFFGGGTPASQAIATNGAGQASFTLTLGAPGSDSVSACLPSCATAKVVFAALSIPVGADAIWTGATSSNWSIASNWSPAVVPTGSNNVFIPNGTPNGPSLSSGVSVNDLTLAAGSAIALATSNLTVGGNLLATGATMSTSTGYVYICGGTHTWSGGVGPLVIDCTATVNVAGAASTNGSLTVQSSSLFNVGAGDVSVTGSVGMYSGARIQMTNAAGKLTVFGNYDSSPGNDVGDGYMTAGLLDIKGNLTGQFGGPGQSFRAVGAHTTRFSGGAAQSINFQYSHEGFHRETFGNLEFTGGNTVTILNNMRAQGSVLVNNNTSITSSALTIYHLGQLTTTAGTNLSGLASTQLNAGGAIFPLVAGVGPVTVEIAGGFTVTLPAGSVTVPTNLATHSGSILDLEAKALIVTGAFSMNSSSRVKMTQPAAYFRVDGTYSSVPGNDVGDTWMTDGVLELRGNLTGQFGGPGQSFRAVGNHVTRFTGSAAQSIDFQYSHEGYHRETFGRLELTGGNTVTLLNNMRVHGTVLVNNNTIVTGSGRTIYHVGQLTTTAGTNLSGLASTQLNGGGAVFPLVAGVGPATVEIAGGFTVTLPSASVTVPTNLATHGGAILDLEGKSLVVTGAFSMNSSSRVKMTQAAAYFRVDGTYSSVPGNDVGDSFMTDGVLELRGDLTGQFGGPGQSFRAVGAHTTRFSGGAAQTINFQYSHEGFHRETFGNLEFTGGNTVTILNNIRAHGTVLVNNNTTVTGGGRTIYHVGQLTTTAGTNLGGLASTQLNGGGAVFPLVAGVGPATVEIAGGFTVTLPVASVTVATNLATHGNAVLDLEAKSLVVTGAFSMNSGSRVKMTQAASYFRVDGTYSSLPGNDVGDGWMTDGVLELRGDLTGQFSGPGQSFRAVGAHTTRFSGAGAQSINFQFAHEGYHRETFGNLEFTGGNTVTILNNMRVHGAVLVNNNTIVTGSGRTIYHVGQLTTTAGTNLSGLASTQLNGGGAVFPLVAGVGPATVEIAGGFTVTLPSASVTVPTSLATHGSAVLDLEARSLIVTGAFSMNSGSRVKMTQAAAFFRVDGTYSSVPGNDVGDSWMTNGVLELRGDLVGQFGGPGQSFRAVGSHTTRFTGTAAQAMTFQYAHEGNHRETFGNLEVTNSTGGVSVGSSGAQVLGNFNLTGIMTVGIGKLLNVGGAITLQSGSTINALGTISRGSCTNLGATITGSGLICP